MIHPVATIAMRSIPAIPQPKWEVTATTGKNSGVFWDSVRRF